MQHLSNFNYPSANVNVNVDTGENGVNVNIDFPSPERLHERFLLMDNLETFYPIPRKLVEVGSTGTYHVHIPYTTNLNNPKWHLFRRRLFLNNQNLTAGVTAGQRKFIPINRPSIDHIAMLHSITYMAYDFNELIPLLSVEDPTDYLTPNMFGTDVHGLRVTTTPVAGANLGYLIPKSSHFTTANYPIYFDAMQRRADELATMELLGQSAPRSSIRGGALPGDFYQNNFWLNLKGYTATTPDFDSPGSEYTNIWQTPEENSSYNVNRDLTSTDPSGKTDMIIPGISNEIDVKIPDNVKWLAVDVAGAGWRHGAFEHNTTAFPNSAFAKVLKGDGSPLGNFFTYVQMPVKVQIDIRYHKIEVTP